MNTARMREALTHIPANDRDTWLKMGMAIKSDLGDCGFDVWEAWSQGDESFNPNDARDVWKSIRANGKVTAGTLFHAAKANGWRDDGTHPKPTLEGIAERQRLAAEREAKNQSEKTRERVDAAKMATALWRAGTPARAEHPYLLRKNIKPVTTLREIDTGAAAKILSYTPKSRGELLAGQLLIVPVKIGDALSTIELIDETGRKSALYGGAKAGGYWATQQLPEGDGATLTLLIGEGVATVLSAQQATDRHAIAALSAGNLPGVARAMRERYSAAKIVILADLVKATGEADIHASEAAQLVGAELAIPDFGKNRPEGATDFNDLAAHCGNAAVRRAIAGAIDLPARLIPQPAEINGANRDVDDWPEPQPLIANVIAEPYPLDALPDTIRAAVEEVTGFVKAPLPMVASSALAALSLASQAHFDVRRDEVLSGPVSLFVMTIAGSGERKSQADKMLTKPIQDYQDAQAEAAKPLMKNYKSAIDTWEAKRNGMKDKIRQLAKEGKDSTSVDRELNTLEHKQPEPPRVPKLIREDATPEGLAKKLQKDWPSAGVVSNEAGIVFGAHGMGSESVMRNLALLNKLWDGGRYQSDRSDDERSRDVRGARLTMGLMIQESTLRAFFDQSKGLARGTGFLARFLIAWPESTMGGRFYTAPVSGSPALFEYSRRITALLNQPVPIDKDGILVPPTVPLSDDAKAAWIEFHDSIEKELSVGGELYDVKDVASKSADNAVRLAALFQHFDGGGGAIGVDVFEGASRIAAWHLNEARRFFGELALPAEMADAARLDSWLIEHCKKERAHFVAKNYVRQHGPLRDGVRLDGAIRELTDLDRVRLVKEGRKLNIQLNPALLNGGATA